MKALVIDKPTKAEDVKLVDYPIPKVKPGWVSVKIRAFGLNHSEQILRLEEISAPYIQKPTIPNGQTVSFIGDQWDV